MVWHWGYRADWRWHHGPGPVRRRRWMANRVGRAGYDGRLGGVPGAMDLGTAAAGNDATFSGDESSRQGQAAATAGQAAPATPGDSPSGGTASTTLERVGGIFSIIGGLAQAALGGAVVVGSGIGTVLSGGAATPVTVGTALVGSGVALHGLDEAWAGCRTVWTGSSRRPYAAQALDNVTGNSTASDLINGGIGVVASAGAGGMVRGAAAAARAVAKRGAVDVFLGAGSEAGFGKLVGWGVGARGAAARTTTITADQCRQMGMTREVAQHWLEFYRSAAAKGRGAATAPERIKLMERILELLN
jgi:hypothetical protein